MKIIFLTLTLVSSIGLADWVEPNFDSCNFYDKAEESVSCQSKGSDYLIGYGKHFCEEFKRKLPDWKTRVQLKKWTEDVGLCLQEMLYDNRKKRLSPCNQLEEFAFDVHPVCYKQYGVCKLGTKDLLSILNVVKGVHMFTRRSVAQADNVILACLGEWVSPEESVAYEQVNLGTQNQSEETKRLALKLFEWAPSDTKNKRRIFFRSVLPELMFNSSSQASTMITDEIVSEYKPPLDADLSAKNIELHDCLSAISKSPHKSSVCGPRIQKKLNNVQKLEPTLKYQPILTKEKLLEIYSKRGFLRSM